jgi:glycosyltransferase involved in cell wall biosynthesis
MYHGTKRSVLQAVLFAASTFRLLTKKFDVIEADHMPYLQLLPLRLVAWVKRVPLVVTWNEVWGEEGWRTYIGRMGSVAAVLERLCVRLSDVLVAISEGTADKLETIGANRSRVNVIPSPLDLTQLMAAAPASNAPELLFVGRLIDHKNANLAIEAASILSGRGHDVRLGVVGVGPEEFRLRKQVEQLALTDRVTFFSTLDSQAELWSLIRGARVLLAPSVREGLGLVVAESLALGTPVVCALHSENESSHFVSQETGSVIEAFSALALANAAELWLNDDSDRSDRISTFLAEHEELSDGAMSASYANILKNCAMDS